MGRTHRVSSRPWKSQPAGAAGSALGIQVPYLNGAASAVRPPPRAKGGMAVCLSVCQRASAWGFTCNCAGLRPAEHKCCIAGSVIVILPALGRARLKHHFTSHVFVSLRTGSLFCPHTFPLIHFSSRGVPALPKPCWFSYTEVTPGRCRRRFWPPECSSWGKFLVLGLYCYPQVGFAGFGEV